MSVRTAVGWTVAREEVLAGTPVTDHWHVVARSDTEEQRITVRRTWLLGRRTGRWGLLLDFAAFGQTLSAEPAVGTVLHADLHHFPGRVPIRALVGVEHEPAQDDVEGPSPSTVAGTLADAGWAIAREPWLERWPGVVRATPTPRVGGPRLGPGRQHGRAAPRRRPRHRDAAGRVGRSSRRRRRRAPRHRLRPTRRPRPRPDRRAAMTTSLADTWAELTATALLGTDRRPLPPPPVGPAGEFGHGSDVAVALLDRAAAVQAARRAGAVPEAAGPPLPACPPDDRPPCLAPAARRLGRILRGEHPDLLEEWLRALTAAGRAAPPEHLVDLVDRTRAAPGLRPVVVEAAGPVAGWLSELLPGLGWAIGPPMDPREAWERGEPAERIEALRRLRSADPAAARELLATGLPGERAELRAAAYGTLAAGLGPEDESLLERGLDDRVAAVRQRAAELLAALPSSAWAQRMARAGGPHGRDHRAGRARPLRDRPRRAGPSQLGSRRHRRGRAAGHLPRRPRPAPGRRRDAARVVGGAGAARAPRRAGGRARAGSGPPVRVEHGRHPPAGRPLGASSWSARRPSPASSPCWSPRTWCSWPRDVGEVEQVLTPVALAAFEALPAPWPARCGCAVAEAVVALFAQRRVGRHQAPSLRRLARALDPAVLREVAESVGVLALPPPLDGVRDDLVDLLCFRAALREELAEGGAR